MPRQPIGEQSPALRQVADTVASGRLLGADDHALAADALPQIERWRREPRLRVRGRARKEETRRDHIIEQRLVRADARLHEQGPGRLARGGIEHAGGQVGDVALPDRLGLAALELAAQCRVARARLVEIELADHLAGLLGETDQRLDVRLSLALVTVEQRIMRTGAQHERELPGQIGGVADAGAHALPHEGRRLVAGIAGEEDAAGAPALGDQRVKAIDRRAPDLDCRRVDEAREVPRHILRRAERLRRLARQELDLPAPQVAWTDDEGRGPLRPAVLDAFPRQFDRTREAHVDHHPPFVEGEVLVADAELPAHEAVGAVAADETARRNGALRSACPACAAQYDVDPVRVRREGDRLGGEKDVRLPRSRHAGAQDRLDLGLDEGPARHPAERMGRRLRVVDADDVVLDAEIVRSRMRRRERRDLVGKAAGLEDPHHLVVERDRARLVVDAGRLLGHRDAQPMARQQRRHGGADGPVAHDQRVGCGGVRHAGMAAKGEQYRKLLAVRHLQRARHRPESHYWTLWTVARGVVSDNFAGLRACSAPTGSTSPAPSSSSLPFTFIARAVCISTLRTSSGVTVGLLATSSAATPLTWAAATDVPVVSW